MTWSGGLTHRQPDADRLSCHRSVGHHSKHPRDTAWPNKSLPSPRVAHHWSASNAAKQPLDKHKSIDGSQQDRTVLFSPIGG